MRYLASILALLLLTSQIAMAEDSLSPAEVEKRIQKHRTAEVTLSVTGPDGKPLAGVPIVARQTRHRFLFGCNAFGLVRADQSQKTRDYQARYAELLNFATLGFYWGSYERTEGLPNEARTRAAAEWCRDNGILVKGHPLCWHQVFPRWLMERPLDEIEKLQVARVGRDVKAFAGLIDRWDVVNEAVVMPDYKQEQTRIPELAKKHGRAGLIKLMFDEARKTNPNATLLLNDYDVSARYEKLIQECLDAKVNIDVIGIQSHMHMGYWGPKKTWDVCERFAKFGKPLHFTETTIISGPRKQQVNWQGPRHTDWKTTPEDEKRQAEQVVEFYTLLFSHPAVEAITWWDFSDSGAWLGAPSGLIREDMSPKPAYEELKKRIKGSWWTSEMKLTTDAQGKATFRGFLGDYAIETAAGKGTFAVGKAGADTAEVRIGK